MVGVLGLVLLFILGLIVAAVFNVYAFVAAQNLELAQYVQEVAANGIGLDTIVYFVAAAAAIMVGARLARWGLYKLARYPAGRTRRTAGGTDRKTTGTMEFTQRADKVFTRFADADRAFAGEVAS